MKIVDISGANYEDIPENYFTHASCRSCLYWEMDGAQGVKESHEREVQKRNWFNSVNLTFEPCGKLAYDDNRVVAWAQYARASYLPRTRTYHSQPGGDAYLISCLAVAPGYRHRGLDEMLLRAVVEDLRSRG